ncbi:MAG: Uma2 family endonuclease [Planctomycetaceae bacterium]|nr:Uma2 family endonuclease [Planctomycetaceae bacterium]
MQTTPPPADIPELPIWRLSVEQYHAMIEYGILQEGEPVELLAGWLALKMTKSPPHESAIRRLRRCLEERVGAEWIVDVQSPIELAESEPEPDLTVVRASDDDYAERHPTAGDVGLVIEVAQTTLGTDRGLKLRIYAAALIVEYWIVNLIDEQVEVYREPSLTEGRATYAKRQDYNAGQSVPLSLAGQPVGEIAVNDVLP